MMLTNGSNYYPSSYGSAAFNSLPHHNYTVRPVVPQQPNSPYYKNSYQRTSFTSNQPPNIKSLPTYRLYDLETNQHHEIIQLIFAYAGISYKDKRLKDDEWKKMKEDQPIDQLPILRVNNDIKIFHLHAILRYLAQDFHLYGRDKHEHGLVDVILEIIRPLEEKIIQNITDEDSLRKILTDDNDDAGDLATYLKQLENCYTIFHRHGPFFLGSYISLADLIVYHLLTYLIRIDSKLLDNYPHLKEARRHLQKHPKIFNYLNKKNVKPSKDERNRTKSPTPTKTSIQQRHRSHDEHQSNHHHHHRHHRHHHHHHHQHRRHSKEPTPSSQRKQLVRSSKSPSVSIKNEIDASLPPPPPQMKTQTKPEKKAEPTVS